MATISEIKQAQAIVSRIQLGRSIRTDPRSVVGRLVNRALQRSIDLQKSLKEAEKKGLLEKFPESQELAKGLIAGEKRQIELKRVADIARDKLRKGENLTVQNLLDLELAAGRRPKSISVGVDPRGFNIPVMGVKKSAEIISPTIIKSDKFLGVKIPEKSKDTLRRIRSSLNVVSGGFFTRRDIKKSQSNLNTQIETFNKQFGNRTLTQQEFNQAKSLSGLFEQEQKRIEGAKKKLKEGATGVFRSFISINEEDPFFFDFDGAIHSKSKDLLKTKNKITSLEGKTGIVANINRKRLKSIEKDQEKAIRNLQAGKVPVLLKGIAPLTPAIGALPKNTKILFVGKQRQIGNKIITDIVFKSGKNVVGKATGVAISKGKNTINVVVGKTGIKGVKIPSAKVKVGRVKKFKSIERAISKPKDVLISKRNVTIKERNILLRKLRKINFQLKEFKGFTRLKKIKLGKDRLKLKAKLILNRRKNILKDDLIKINSELKSFKGITRARKIKASTKKLTKKAELSLNRKRNILKDDLRKIDTELKSLKVIKGAKKIKESVSKIKFKTKLKLKLVLNRRKNIIQDKLRNIDTELKSFKGITRARKIKASTKKLTKKAELILNRRKNIFKDDLRNINTELKSFKGITRLKKIKLGKDRLKLKAKLILNRRKNIIQDKLRNIDTELKSFKGITRARKIKTAVRKKFPKRIELIQAENVKALRQISTGRQVIKGKTTDIISKANVFTDKDISLITGKTFTSRGDLIKFLGWIKGSKSSKEIFTGSQALKLKQAKVFKKALKDVLAVAGSQAKARQVSGLSSTAKSIISSGQTLAPVISKVKISPKVAQITKTQIKQRANQIIRLKSDQLAKQLQKLKQIAKIKQTAKTTQQTKQIQKQLQGLKTKQTTKQIQKLITAKPTTPTITTITTKTGIIIPFGFFKKKKRITRKPIPQLKQGFNVLIKSKGKFIKINRLPLSKKDAKDRMAFGIDHSTARTGKFLPAGKVKTLGKLTKGEGGAFSKARPKIRGFKIKKGKKIKIINKFIEKKGKPLIDQLGEKQGLNIARLAKQRGFIGKPKKISTPKIKRSSTSQFIANKRLKSLAKARAVLKSQRKGQPSQSTSPRKKIVIPGGSKRTLSPAQLNALAKGRRKRLTNLNKRRR